MATPDQAVGNLRRKKATLSILLIILLVIIAALSYFIITGRKPHGLVPGLGLNKPDYLFSFYGKGKIGNLNNPNSIAVDDKTDTVYVVDRLNYRVVAFDLQGEPLFEIKKLEGKYKQFINASYVAVDNKSQVYVSDTSPAAIFVFDSKGKYIKMLEPKEKGKPVTWSPLGITFDAEDNIYVADKGSHRVVKVDPTGTKVLMSFGKFKQVTKAKSDGGSLNFPNDIAVADDGSIYVSDSNNFRIQVFDSNGKFKKVLAAGGIPRGLGLIEGGASAGLYAVNGIDQKVSVFNQSTGVLNFDFGEGGAENGQFNFPNDLDIVNERLYVVDTYNNRVQVWSF